MKMTEEKQKIMLSEAYEQSSGNASAEEKEEVVRVSRSSPSSVIIHNPDPLPASQQQEESEPSGREEESTGNDLQQSSAPDPSGSHSMSSFREETAGDEGAGKKEISEEKDGTGEARGGGGIGVEVELAPQTGTGNGANAGTTERILKIFCHNCSQKLDVTSLVPFSHFDCPSCGAELIVPKWFDNYLLEEPGGVGGMATVYRALDIALDREVAIKVLKQEVADTPGSSELFLNEARTAATINHYAVVPIYTCGVYEGQTYIIMQYMGGGSLETQLKLNRGLLPLRDVIRWIHDIAEGLENARLHGIVHHDIKPGNILLDIEGNAKIGDFGIAQIIKDNDPERMIEQTTRTWVSPHYVSPEKVRTKKEDFRGDIYSLGATFYHLATGFTPFSHDDMDELIRMRLTHDPMYPHLHRAELSSSLSRLIMAMMDRDPERRPSYQEIIGELSEALKSGQQQTQSFQKVKKNEKPARQIVVPKDLLSQNGLKQHPASTGKTGFLVFLLLLVILLVLSFFAWREGILNRYFAFLPPPPGHVEFQKDLVPEVSLALSLGNPRAAVEFAEPILESGSEQDQAKREQAATQLALAYYLAGSQDAAKRCAELEKKLSGDGEGTQESAIGQEKSSPALDIIRHLALLPEGKEGEAAGEESALSEKISSFPDDFQAAGELALLLKGLRDSSPTQPERFLRNFPEILSKLPDSSWAAASWGKRVPYWKQTLMDRNGIAADLETAFAGLLEKKSPWRFEKVDSSRIFADFELPGAIRIDFSNELAGSGDGIPFGSGAAQQQQEGAGVGAAAVMPSSPGETVPAYMNASKQEKMEITEENLAALDQDFMKTRPTPLSPAALTQKEVSTHLLQLPLAKRRGEAERASILLETKDFITKMMLKIPYEAESFSSISETFGPGILMANPRYLSYKTDKGERSRLEWSQIPVEEYMRIIFHYARLRESILASETNISDANKKVLAWDYLRLAVLSAWYGNYADAAEASKKAISVYPEISKDVYRLLFN